MSTSSLTCVAKSDAPHGARRTAPRPVTNCPLCRAPVATFLPARIPGIMACYGCGLAFVHPQPTDSELEAIYTEKYYEPFGFSSDHQLSYRLMKQTWFDRLLGIAEGYVSVGKLLDVGSGLGDLLAVGIMR